MLSRFLNCPRETHWNGAKKVLQYIKGTSQFGIVLEKNDKFMLTGFTYVDWASGIDERESTTSYAFNLGNGVISWASKK